MRQLIAIAALLLSSCTSDASVRDTSPSLASMHDNRHAQILYLKLPRKWM